MSERNPCLSCSAPATLFICSRCIDELRAELVSLIRGDQAAGRPTPGLLDSLGDVALKRTCLGGASGHRKRGDELPAPFEPDTERGRLTAQGRAEELLAKARNTLTTIVRDACESRGVQFQPPRTVGAAFHGPLLPGWRRLSSGYQPRLTELARWLSDNVHTLACDESAGQWRAEVGDLVRSIVNVIDRPTRRTWLGECPTWNEGTRMVCGVSLWAPEDSVEVTCPRCRQEHNCNRLRLLQFNDLERTKVPWERILQANKSQPPDRQVPERTLRSWRLGSDEQLPRLRVRGYQRPDGSRGIARHSEEDVELYLWPDVRRLRDERPQKGKTGAAARRVAG